MSVNNTNVSFPILNPDVYLNYLAPETANQFEVTRNLYLATLGALLWDILSSLPQDVTLFRSGPFRPTIIAYFLSRTAALGFVLLSVIAKTHPMQPHCVQLELGVTCCWVVAISSASFLFLRRVQAVYQGSKTVIYVFYILWIANVGISFLAPIGSHAGPLAATGYCVNTGIEHYVSAATFMPLAFDSLVVIAISYKICTSHGLEGEQMTWRTLWYGKALPRISKALLQGGQQYYLITVGANILVSVLIVAPSVPPVYQATFTSPDLALTSVMACRVFRNLKFNAFDKGQINRSTIQFARKNNTEDLSGPSATDTTGASVSEISRPAPLYPVLRDLEKGGDEMSLEELKFKANFQKGLSTSSSSI